MGGLVTASQKSASEWLFGHGEMADRIRSFDWARTPVGSPQQWPQSLKTAVQILLGSRYPMFLWWGKPLTNFYNDAYAPMLGTRHPTALGQSAFEVWADVWPICGPQAEAVLNRGESSWNEELLLVMERNGFVEEAYFTFSYSPVMDEGGLPNGVFAAVTEETARVLSRRRLKTLRELGESALADAKTDVQACRGAARALAGNQNDVPFALIYLLDDDARRCRLCEPINYPAGNQASPKEVVLAEDSDIWNFQAVHKTKRSEIVEHLGSRFGRLPAGPWKDDAAERALVLPLAKAGVQEMPAGFLVAGLSPRLQFTEEYRGFLELAAGHIASAIANARAYQEERRRAEALAELDRAKTKFFNNVSHEFRTPLTLMLGPLEELLNHRGPGPDDRVQLETLHRNSLRLLKLVNTLLDFSRLESGRIHATYEPADLAALTRELASAFQSALEKAGLQYDVRCPPLREEVWFDRDMWEKIVFNLLSNAFKFTKEGRIAVTLGIEDQAAILRVGDTGAGIPEQEIPNLFKRFHRVPNTYARTHEGTGIGLALVYELVKLHGGTILVDSQIGRGTVFTVRIPLGKGHLPPERIGAPRVAGSTGAYDGAFLEEALHWLPDDKAARPPGATAPGSASPAKPARVLVVDDNSDMRAYICRLLRKHYEVESEPDGAAALVSASRRKPDLILSDLMMPRMDGLALLEAIRADPQLKLVPVILLSARAGDEARSEGIEHGADDYLIKPFSGRELLARVETHLNLARLRQEVAAHERKLDQEARLAKERLDSVLSSIEELFLIVDADWRFLYVNDRVLEVSGKTRAQLLGSRLWDLFAGADTGQFKEDLLKAAGERQPAHFEYFCAPWGRWFENRVYPMAEGMAILATDITQKRQVEEALRQSSERFRITAAATGVTLFEQDRDLRYVWLHNPIPGTALENVVGRREEEIPQMVEDLAALIRVKREVLATGCGTRIEVVYRLPDGIRRYYEVSLEPKRDSAGHTIGLLGAGIEITVRKRADQQQKSLFLLVQAVNEARALPEIYEAALEAIFQCTSVTRASIRFKDSDGIMRFQAWRGFSEEYRQNVASHSPWNSDWPDPQPVCLSHPADFPADLALVLQREGVGSLAYIPITWERSLVGKFTIGYDQPHRVTQEELRLLQTIATQLGFAVHRQRTAESLEHLVQERTAKLQDMVGELRHISYAITHDMRAPLRAMNAFADAILDEISHDQQQSPAIREACQRIMMSSARLDKLIQDSLNYTKLALKEVPLQPVKLSDLIPDLIESYPNLQPHRSRIRITDPLPVVLGEESLLTQCFSNLLGNAVKFVPPGTAPEVVIRSAVFNKTARITIQDNGIGIPAHAHQRLFNMFQRLTSKYEGTGIGLAIVRKVVERMGGKVGLESVPGQGTSFWVELQLPGEPNEDSAGLPENSSHEDALVKL